MKIDDIYRGLSVLQDSGESGIVKKAELTKDTMVNAHGVDNKDAKVDISATSIMINKVRASIDVEDPERAEKIRAIKAQIETGTYEIRPQKIAEKIMQDSISRFFED